MLFIDKVRVAMFSASGFCQGGATVPIWGKGRQAALLQSHPAQHFQCHVVK